MAEVFVVSGLGGKRTLHGEIAVCGAKNAALKMLAASLLFQGGIRYERIPQIEDVHRMLDLLRGIGVGVELQKGKSAHGLSLTVSGTLSPEFPREIAKRLRASIVLAGPLLARRGKVLFPHPGGCVIGERPIDLFLEGFEKMGATVKFAKDTYMITAPREGLRGAHIFFRNQTVTGTETFMMTATLARGVTVLENAAMEPEIVALAEWLVACGADIEGAGTPTITIRGGKPLIARKPGVVMPDRIEAGSFLILAALAAKDVRITDCDARHLESLIATLRYSGVELSLEKDGTEIRVRAPRAKSVHRGVNIRTHEYPGFPTDLQAPMTVYLTQTQGESIVFETIFEGRLAYIESLNRMGADIKTMDTHRVLVKGPTPFKGKQLESPDLRAGLAFVIAATIAKGESTIHNVYNIDRGYESIEKRLQKIGVPIKRLTI